MILHMIALTLNASLAPSQSAPNHFKERSMLHHLTVTGMTCGHCEKAVTQALQQVDTAAQVRIDRTANQVEVESTAGREALVQAITEEGYEVAPA
jgi:copper chaperone